MKEPVAVGPGTPIGGENAPPEVTAVIPCYESAHWIADSLESVMSQQGVEVEVLVIDDGSPDGAELANAVQQTARGDPRVRLLREPHRGLSGARNAGLNAARGRWVAFLDADDAWLPGLLRGQIDRLESEGADVAYCDAAFFGDPEKEGSTVMRWDPSDGEVTLGAILTGRCVPVMSTIVARTDAIRKVGGFDEDTAWGEDLELWARLAAEGARFTWSTSVGSRRRIHDGNMSRDTVRMATGQIEVIERYVERVPSNDPDKSAISDRLQDLRHAIHLSRASEALAAGRTREARRELWLAWRANGAPKHLAGAVALALVPGLARRALTERMT